MVVTSQDLPQSGQSLTTMMIDFCLKNCSKLILNTYLKWENYGKIDQNLLL